MSERRDARRRVVALSRIHAVVKTALTRSLTLRDGDTRRRRDGDLRWRHNRR